MLYEIIYRSTARFDFTDDDLKNILDWSHTYNNENGLTGCLLYHEGQFLQMLEGEFQVVLDLYEKIKKDSRHRDFLLLHMQEAEQRVFSKWTMAFKSVDNKDLENYSGVSEFKQLETESQNSSMAKELFLAISNDLISH